MTTAGPGGRPRGDSKYVAVLKHTGKAMTIPEIIDWLVDPPTPRNAYQALRALIETGQVERIGRDKWRAR